MFPNHYAFDSLGYNSFYPLMMQQMMNYYQQMPYLQANNIAFQGYKPQQSPNSIMQENKEKNTQLVAVHTKTGITDDINIYEVTPEKLENYKANLKKFEKDNNTKNTLRLLSELGIVAGCAAIGTFIGPKICQKLNIQPGSWLDAFFGNKKSEQRIASGLYSTLLSLIGFAIVEEFRTPETAEKVVQQSLGDPITDK